MQDLVKQLALLLNNKQIKISVAESCTGGLLAATLTHKPGASIFFDRGFVTYSNEAKNELLEVPDDILSNYGAVSSQTAEAMASGALKHSNSGLTVSITGIAGPDGGSNEKPVGLVYFGYALKGGSSGSLEHRFEGSREQIQVTATKTALKHLITILENTEEE